MKPIVAALFSIVAAAATAAAVPTAVACGPYGAETAPVRERATGQRPSIARVDGVARLELVYPKFAVSGEHLYLDHFELVADRHLRALEQRLARGTAWSLSVSVEEVAPGRWRVIGWRDAPRAR